MTRQTPRLRPLTSPLLRTVSHGAQEFRLFPPRYGFQLSPGYGQVVADPLRAALSDPALALLARMRLWLKLMWQLWLGIDRPSRGTVLVPHSGSNRRSRRLSKSRLPIARSNYALGHILLRHYGFTRFVQWLYRFSLASRGRWCFMGSNKHLPLRGTVMGRGLDRGIAAICAAPLRPD